MCTVFEEIYGIRKMTKREMVWFGFDIKYFFVGDGDERMQKESGFVLCFFSRIVFFFFFNIAYMEYCGSFKPSTNSRRLQLYSIYR